MDPSKEVSASEKERKPAGEESEEPSSKLLRTSTRMLTLSEEECLDLKTEISWPEEELRFMKRPSMLDVPALLLTTLEEFTEEQLKTFQSNLTSVQLPGFPLIPESQLENTDRQDTVDQMVKRYGPERAVEITLNTMRKMDLGDLAEKLERDHRGVLQAPQKTLKEMPSSSSHSPPRTPDSPLLLEPNDPIVGQAFTLPSATDGTMEEESQDCVRVHLSDSLPEAMDELNITECRVVDQSLCTTDPRMRSPENFEPEIYDREGKGAYRFQCPSAGLFQCSITGLVFRMEGEGEVLYRTVPWNRRLLAKRGKRPAGPLFNIDCSQKSVCQLRLPHCEIHSEGGCDFLSVAHVTDDDSMEFLHPHETTETHVILNINGFSKYGITKDKEAPVSPIRGLVLLFYQLPDDKNNSTLNVLLLPRNVDIDEVCEKRRRRNGDREIYIEINPNCRLTPDQKYTLSTDLTDEHHIDPKEAEFVDYDFYTNYTPTFQLDLQTVIKKVNLLLKEHDGPENQCVWDRLVSLPVSPTEVPSSVTPPGGATAASKLLVPAAHPMDISTHPPQRTYPTSMEPVAASEREQKPAGAHNANLPSTSSGMLTRSVEKRRRLERQREEPRALGIKRPSMLDVPALLLTTLEELTGEQLKTFQCSLTSGLLPDCPPIPESQLENTDRQDTVDQMVKTYGPERAVEITLTILRGMNLHDLAKKLQRDHTVTPPGGATAGTTKVHFLLLDTLEELGPSDLNTFQWYLIKGVEGFPSISKGQLGDAGTLVTVDRMVQSYGDEGAVKFTLKILRKMGQNKLADELKEKVTKNV